MKEHKQKEKPMKKKTPAIIYYFVFLTYERGQYAEVTPQMYQSFYF